MLGGLTSEAVGLISDKLLTVLKDSTYNIQIGNFMSISNCICTGINSIAFSNKVDENGYPISGSLNLVLRHRYLRDLSSTSVIPKIIRKVI